MSLFKPAKSKLIDLDGNLSSSFFLVSMTYRESYLFKTLALLEEASWKEQHLMGSEHHTTFAKHQNFSSPTWYSSLSFWPVSLGILLQFNFASHI